MHQDTPSRWLVVQRLETEKGQPASPTPRNGMLASDPGGAHEAKDHEYCVVLPDPHILSMPHRLSKSRYHRRRANATSSSGGASRTPRRRAPKPDKVLQDRFDQAHTSGTLARDSVP